MCVVREKTYSIYVLYLHCFDVVIFLEHNRLYHRRRHTIWRSFQLQVGEDFSCMHWRRQDFDGGIYKYIFLGKYSKLRVLCRIYLGIGEKNCVDYLFLLAPPL